LRRTLRADEQHITDWSGAHPGNGDRTENATKPKKTMEFRANDRRPIDNRLHGTVPMQLKPVAEYSAFVCFTLDCP
jgi:hypothetical protein